MDILQASAAEILAALRDGSLSAETLMAQTLDRIAATNGDVNAIVALRERDELMAEARAADAATGDRGPMHGFPIAVKDLVFTKGIRTTMGSPVFADFVPETDDILAERLRAAGAILIGKTNVPEFGLGSHTFNPVYGPTRNPYDLRRSAGGSSGGSAAALATRMLALADGSDMMGSLRNPAAWNNVYGFRPSWDVVPMDPRGETFISQLATLGPMARSPEDIAILLDVIAGPDKRVPHGRPWEKVSPLQPADLSGLRVGWLGDWGGSLPMEDGVMDTCRSTLDVLCDLGAVVEDLDPPFDMDDIWQSWIGLRSTAVAGLSDILGDKLSLTKETAQWEVNRGIKVTALEIHRLSLIRSRWYTKAAELFDDYDILIMPSAQMWPFDVTLDYPREVAGVEMDTYHRWMQVVVPAGLIGLPVLAVPSGFGEDGLPMGVQMIGANGSDKRLLAIGATYHEATRWPQKHPPG
jgi:amidase